MRDYLIVAFIFILMLAPSLKLGWETDDDGIQPFENKKIRCVIAVKDKPGRYSAGLSCALLEHFAEDRQMEIELRPSMGKDWTDSLYNGNIEILVMPQDVPFSDKMRRSPAIGGAVWLVSTRNVVEMKHIERWLGTESELGHYEETVNRFMRDYNPRKHRDAGDTVDRLSPYDELFIKCAMPYDEDWRLIAAIGWNESKFCINCESEAGGCGTMQILRRTLRKYGIENVFDQEANIRIATDYFEKLKKKYSKAGLKRDDDVIAHALAAYNKGEGSIEIGNVDRYSGYVAGIFSTYKSMRMIYPFEGESVSSNSPRRVNATDHPKGKQ